MDLLDVAATGSTTDVIFVYTTWPDRKSAEGAARKLVGDGYAACANILDGMTSIYFWKEEVESASETVMILKTSRFIYPQLEKKILSAHPYELPCIAVINIANGLPAYLEWIIQGSQAPQPAN